MNIVNKMSKKNRKKLVSSKFTQKKIKQKKKQKL